MHWTESLDLYYRVGSHQFESYREAALQSLVSGLPIKTRDGSYVNLHKVD